MTITIIRSFNFNGIDKPDWLLIKKSNRPMSPKQTATLLNVPQRAGAYYFGKSTDVRPLAFEFIIMADNDLDLWKKAEWVTDWLDTEEPAALIINDEPDRIYYAVLEASGDDLEQLAAMGDSVLNFICPDPFKYTQEYTQDIKANPTILNDGNADIYPKIEATFTADSTHFAIAAADRFLLIGEPEDVEKTNRPRLELVKDFNLSTVTNWSASGTRIDPGTVTGAMSSDGSVFKVDTYGTGATWHGPALKTILDAPLDNYRVEAMGTFDAESIKQLGRLELYGFDANGKMIWKMGLRDTSPTLSDTWAHFRLGEANADPYYIYNSHGSKAGVYNDFYGMLRIEKDGKNFNVFVGKYDPQTKTFHTRASATFTDGEGLYQEDLAQIQLHIGATGTHPGISFISWDSVKVYRVNEIAENQTNLIFRTGDELIIDNDKKQIFKNGAPYMQHLAFESQFLRLQPGSNTLAITPENVANVTARYRKRFK